MASTVGTTTMTNSKRKERREVFFEMVAVVVVVEDCTCCDRMQWRSRREAGKINPCVASSSMVVPLCPVTKLSFAAL